MTQLDLLNTLVGLIEKDHVAIGNDFSQYSSFSGIMGGKSGKALYVYLIGEHRT